MNLASNEKAIIERKLFAIVKELCSGNLKKVISDKKSVDLSEREIREAISQYPGKITMPPKGAFSKYYKYFCEVQNSYILEFDLWYDNKVSDLTLILEVKKKTNGDFITQIQDIRVL